MAALITNRNDIIRICRERQTLEQELAGRIYHAFARPRSMERLQLFADRVLESIESDRIDGPKLRVLSQYINVLDIFKKFPDGNLNTIRRRISTLTPSDIADVIFICGEWIIAGGGTMDGFWSANEVQESYKPGVSPKGAAGRREAGWAMEEAERNRRDVWKAETGGRYRGNWSGGIEPHIAELLGPSSVHGMSAKRSMVGSTVLKINSLFGLLTGADISGSTAEGASTMERWGADILHPVCYLLPLATLVYNAHHTLLEVALTLSLNKVVDYHIGFYTSLLPATPPDYLADVQTALIGAEARSKHFIVYYNRNQPAGLIYFTQKWAQLRLRRSRLTQATALLVEAQSLPPFPSRNDVLSLIHKMDPGMDISVSRLR